MQIKVASPLCQISMAKLYWTFGEAARKVGRSVLAYIVSAGLTLLLLKLFGPPPYLHTAKSNKAWYDTHSFFQKCCEYRAYCLVLYFSLLLFGQFSGLMKEILYGLVKIV